MRCAQAGEFPVAEEAAAAGAALEPLSVPAVDVPPVAPKLARAPSLKLDLTLWLARDAARLRGDTAARC